MNHTHLLYIPFLLICLSCGNKSQSEQQAPPRPVKVVQVKALGTIDKVYTATVQAEEFSILAFKVAGPLTAMLVDEGQNVEKGDLIARIDPFDYQLKYNTAKEEFNTTKAIYERTERLFAARAVATQNLEIAKADYIRATSAVNIAERTLDYTRLTAPFSGIIEKKYAENFQKIQVGESIVKLVNPDRIEIYFILPETNTNLIEIPKTIFVEFDTHKGKLFTAGIKEYIYASDGSGIPITLKITDSEFAPYRKDVFPGFSCKVYFKLQNTVSDNYIIPGSALFTEGGNNYLWVVDPQTLTTYKQKVSCIRFDNQALIKEGLHSDNLIVTAGVQYIREGQKVSLLSPNGN